MRSLAHAKAKRTRAVELVVAGHSYDEIAQQVGFAHRGSAHRAVSKALAEREVEAIDDLRRLELDRLDRLQAALWPKALAGDPAAAIVILRVIDQRIRLLGLVSHARPFYDGPTTLVIGPAEGNPGEATV